MSRLKLIDARTMEKLLHHKARVLLRPLIREILREIEISIEDYNRRLDEL